MNKYYIILLVILSVGLFIATQWRTFFKHKYIKEIYISKTRTITARYIKRDNYKPNYLINPEHIFISRGYQTVIITETSGETINPLDFESKYPAEKFKTAIESKIIKDTFSTLKKNKYDLSFFSLIGIGIIIIILIYIIRAGGLI